MGDERIRRNQKAGRRMSEAGDGVKPRKHGYVALCDLCRHYAFNGDDGVYTGDGRCMLRDEPRDPDDSCGYFECWKIEAPDCPAQ
jgi:hypothetical protein